MNRKIYGLVIIFLLLAGLAGAAYYQGGLIDPISSVYQQFLKLDKAKMLDWLKFGSGTKNSPSPTPSTKKSIVVGAIKMKSNDRGNADILLSKINALLKANSKVDLIVTPEYSLYEYVRYGAQSFPLRIINRSGSYEVINEAKTAKSAINIKNAILKIQALAKEKGFNIVLGTVPEVVYKGEEGQKSNVIFNSQLVIDSNGKIIGVRRKVSGSDSNTIGNSLAYSLALKSVRSFSLTNKNKKSFSILPIICAEKGSGDLLNKATSYGVDFIVNSESEGDTRYEEITKSIQAGTFSQARATLLMTIIDNMIQNYTQSRNVLKKNTGYLLVSDLAMPQGGIINLNNQPSKLKSLSVTNNYVVGEVEL